MDKPHIEELLELLPQAALILEPDGSVVYGNRRASTLLAAELGWGCSLLFPSFLAGKDKHLLDKLLLGFPSPPGGGNSRGGQLELLVSGRTLPVAVSLSEFPVEQHTGYLLLLHEISRQMERERQRLIQHDFTQSLLSIPDMEGAADALLQAGLTITGYDNGAFYYLNPEREVWNCLAAEGPESSRMMEFPLSRYLGRGGAAVGKLLAFSESGNPDNPPLPPFFKTLGAKEALVLPVFSKRTVLALLVLISGTAPSPDAETLKSLEVMAGQCGLLMGRISSEERFKRSEEFNHLLLRSMPSGLLVRDMEGVIIHFNEAAEGLLGVDALEVIGKRTLPGKVKVFTDAGQRISQPDLPALKILETGEAVNNLQIRVERPDGSDVWISLSGQPLKQFGPGKGQETLKAAVLTMKDITAQKKMLDELDRARRTAESANSSKSQFLANISHEIRTPLSGIMGMTEILLAGSLSEDQKENLILMKEAEESLLDIINKVLEISKIESGKIILEKEPFRLRGAVNKASLPVFMSCKEKGIVLDIDISPDIPDQLIGDGARLTQVLTNLLSNALKFTERGSITLRVRPSTFSEMGKVELAFSVEDTGIGIPLEEQSSIFDDFTQIDPGRGHKHQGTGLGLAISKKLVELMGGQIGVVSSPGRGSSFHFTARFYLSTLEETPVLRESVTLDRPGRLRILLTEDNALNQRSIRHFLESAGHSVVVTGNGEEALEALEKDPFDVILMDVQMPVMDGLEATRRIRSHDRSRFNPDIPIIALTAYALKEDEFRFITSGMDRYVTKPVRKELLFQAIQELTGSPESTLVDLGQGIFRPQEDLYEFLRDYQNDLDIAGQILDLYIEEYPEKRDELLHALQISDRSAAAGILHSITNNLSALRVFHTGNDCHLAEVLANDGELEEVKRRMEQILPRLEEIHGNAIRCRKLIQSVH